MGIQNNKNEQIAKEEIAAFRVQFFLNKFSLPHSGNKSDALFKIENFLRHNFANLLSVEPAHIIGVKCHRCPRMHSLYCHPIQSFAKLCCSMPASLSAQWQR